MNLNKHQKMTVHFVAPLSVRAEIQSASRMSQLHAIPLANKEIADDSDL